MNKCKKYLDEIDVNSAKTIQSSTFLEALKSDQKIKLEKTINLLTADNKLDSTVVFRGVGYSHLLPILTLKNNRVDERKLISLLFYFGEKAKNYYKCDNKKAEDSRWIKDIEDCSEVTIETIYEKIKKVLKNNRDEISKFKKNSPDFSEFFLGNNKAEFVELVKGNVSLRDYYLFFLHTAGKIGIDEKDILVSTSTSPEVPPNFFIADENNYVICYVIPPKLEKYSVSYLTVANDNFVKDHSNKLPVYERHSLYEDQNEIAVKGALFSHNMLGIMKYSKKLKKTFFANPHLFTAINTPSDILKGLFFDQSFFDVKLKETGYYRGVGLSVDAQYHTIHTNT